MKNILQKIKKGRYLLHLVLGFLIGSIYAFLMYKFIIDNHFVVVPCTTALGVVVGIMWEMDQEYINKNVRADVIDIISTALGFLIGSLIVSIFF